MSELERATYWLTMGLALAIVVITAYIMKDWLGQRPPDLTSNATPEQQKQLLESAKSLSDLQWERTSRFFDLVIAKALLPLLATLIGFLIGKRVR
jgi:hypothetical protein